MSAATDADLVSLGERFEKLLLEYLVSWLDWAPRMRAAHALLLPRPINDRMASRSSQENWVVVA
jgi:hypothetical protein